MAESHIRIDEGLKRGPRKRLGKLTNPSPKADLGSWQIPPDLKPEDVLDQYLTEQTTSQIAARFGLSRKALVRWLREVVPDQWRQVQLIRAHCRIEDGEDGIEGACDALSLARAREQVRAAQFRLQAIDVDYQPKQQISVKNEPLSDQDVGLLQSAQELLGLFKSRLIAAPAPEAEKVIESVSDSDPASA